MIFADLTVYATRQFRVPLRRRHRLSNIPREMGGAGLGLSIARWIVGEHRGSIEVQSQPGHGSTLAVRIPLADVASRTDSEVS